MEIYVLWETVPETTQIFWLCGLSEADHACIRRCHGKCVNVADNTPEDEADLAWLMEFLGKNPDSVIFDSDSTSSEPIEINGIVVASGFML